MFERMMSPPLSSGEKKPAVVKSEKRRKPDQRLGRYLAALLAAGGAVSAGNAAEAQTVSAQEQRVSIPAAVAETQRSILQEMGALRTRALSGHGAANIYHESHSLTSRANDSVNNEGQISRLALEASSGQDVEVTMESIGYQLGFTTAEQTSVRAQVTGERINMTPTSFGGAEASAPTHHVNVRLEAEGRSVIPTLMNALVDIAHQANTGSTMDTGTSIQGTDARHTDWSVARIRQNPHTYRFRHMVVHVDEHRVPDEIDPNQFHYVVTVEADVAGR